jgi:hypothetical protein
LIQTILPLALASVLGSGATLRAADPDPQEAAITKTAAAFVEAFHKGDAKAVAAFLDAGRRLCRSRRARAQGPRSH